ncbi:MAG: alpha-glucan family phosphorylase [Luteolibacter sp.]
MMKSDRQIAYFSMEIALEPEMPTYCGGLGFLAGDLLRAAADRNLQMIGVSLLHRKGYFRQRLDENGGQTEEPCEWQVEDFLQELFPQTTVSIEGRMVHLRAWQYEIKGVKGGVVPVYLLDADLPQNAEWDRHLTDRLYGGDNWYRLCQEIVLGIGGVRILRALGHTGIERYHMNEGHASLLAMELLDETAADAGRGKFNHDDVDTVRRKCVFTTHTPVPAGHDKFPIEMVTSALGRNEVSEMREIFCCGGELNMTYLALNLSHYINGVAKKHTEISMRMFAGYKIEDITNGVHVPTWTSPSFQRLYDRHIPGWREDSFSLRSALSLPSEEVWEAHAQAKAALIERVNRETNVGMEANVLTFGFARRIADYKRAALLFHDIERLKSLAKQDRGFQVVIAGKAHPGDGAGIETIRIIFRAIQELKGHIRIAYLNNYNWGLGSLMTAGVDVWLNTPLPPKEASGTSGMKAAMNGVPSLSILDGWWIEGCIEGITGWSIGSAQRSGEVIQTTADDAASLYQKMESVVIPLYYNERGRFLDVMRHTIALNGAFFTSQRMLLQYVLNAYFE